MMSTRIRLGDVARDTISGYTGVVIGITKWLHGCKRLTLQSQQLHNGKPIDAVTFDLPQVALVDVAIATSTNSGGGPRPEPERKALS